MINLNKKRTSGYGPEPFSTFGSAVFLDKTDTPDNFIVRMTERRTKRIGRSKKTLYDGKRVLDFKGPDLVEDTTVELQRRLIRIEQDGEWTLLKLLNPPHPRIIKRVFFVEDQHWWEPQRSMPAYTIRKLNHWEVASDWDFV